MSKLKAKDPKSATPSKPKILVYGPPKAGKTYFALDFPSVYYIDTEGGANLDHYTDKLTKSGGVYFGPAEGALDPEELIGQFQALATEEHAYKTVVLDSVSKIWNSIITNEAARLGDKDAFGASKKPAIQFMRRLISWIDRIDMNVVLIAHEKATWVADKQGEPTFDAFEKLGYELHLLFRAEKRGPKRLLVTKYSRFLQFTDGENLDLSYNAFAEKFGRDVIERAGAKVEIAGVEEVSEMKRLSELIKVSHEDVEKWLTKAGATCFEDMPKDKAKALVSFWQNKINGKT